MQEPSGEAPPGRLRLLSQSRYCCTVAQASSSGLLSSSTLRLEVCSPSVTVQEPELSLQSCLAPERRQGPLVPGAVTPRPAADRIRPVCRGSAALKSYQDISGCGPLGRLASLELRLRTSFASAGPGPRLWAWRKLQQPFQVQERSSKTQPLSHWKPVSSLSAQSRCQTRRYWSP